MNNLILSLFSFQRHIYNRRSTRYAKHTNDRLNQPEFELRWTKEGFAKLETIPNVTKRLTVKPSLYFDSNTDIAASEPDPIVANGNVSVDPWGYICRRRHYIQICKKLSLSGQRGIASNLQSQTHRMQMRSCDIDTTEYQSSLDITLVAAYDIYN